MIEQVPMSSLVVLVGFLSGFLLALGYFMQLRYAVDNLIRRGFSPSLVFGALLKICGTLAVFVLLMWWSSLAAISGLVGFSLARGWFTALQDPSS